LDLAGLVDSIISATASVDAGRKGFATKGKAEEGRISFEKGIALALKIFQQAQIFVDPLILILVEYTFITQELALCDKSDKDTINSLKRAIKFFDDAFLALQAVEEAGYKIAEKTYPHDKDYRFKGYPLDAYHIACHGHKTRLQNILKTPGLDPIEKALLKQRLANMVTAQEAYAKKQEQVLGNR